MQLEIHSSLMPGCFTSMKKPRHLLRLLLPSMQGATSREHVLKKVSAEWLFGDWIIRFSLCLDFSCRTSAEQYGEILCDTLALFCNSGHANTFFRRLLHLFLSGSGNAHQPSPGHASRASGFKRSMSIWRMERTVLKSKALLATIRRFVLSLSQAFCVSYDSELRTTQLMPMLPKGLPAMQQQTDARQRLRCRCIRSARTCFEMLVRA